MPARCLMQEREPGGSEQYSRQCDRHRLRSLGDCAQEIRAPSAAALVTTLPFRDRSFDLSLCSNVLEHLTEPDLARAFGELARVSSKYVMIVSPIGEPMETQLTTCQRCGCQFHPNGHRRGFKVPDFEAGLPEFATETVSFFAEPF